MDLRIQPSEPELEVEPDVEQVVEIEITPSDEPVFEEVEILPPMPVPEDTEERIELPDESAPWSWCQVKPSPELLVRIFPPPEQPAEEPAPEPEPPSSYVEALALDEENEPPVYPLLARRLGVEGVVILEVTVDVRGCVRKVELLQSAGSRRAQRQMDRAASLALKTWRYQPAVRDGVPVEAVIRVPVEFRIDPSGRSDGQR